MTLIFLARWDLGVHDGDGRPTTKRVLVKEWGSQTWLIGVYYGRKLGMDPPPVLPQTCWFRAVK